MHLIAKLLYTTLFLNSVSIIGYLAHTYYYENGDWGNCHDIETSLLICLGTIGLFCLTSIIYFVNWFRNDHYVKNICVKGLMWLSIFGYLGSHIWLMFNLFTESNECRSYLRNEQSNYWIGCIWLLVGFGLFLFSILYKLCLLCKSSDCC